MAELNKSDKRRLDNSYEFGFNAFWEFINNTKDKDLDTEAVGMEILYQAVHFLDSKCWAEDEILKYIKNAYKDAMANQLYKQELSKAKAAHRQPGQLTDTERAVMATKKRSLKKNDSVNITKDINTEELAAEKPEAAEMN